MHKHHPCRCKPTEWYRHLLPAQGDLVLPYRPHISYVME
nr:MAG TPA: hypothetical protein [Phage sp. ctgku9]